MSQPFTKSIKRRLPLWPLLENGPLLQKIEISPRLKIKITQFQQLLRLTCELFDYDFTIFIISGTCLKQPLTRHPKFEGNVTIDQLFDFLNNIIQKMKTHKINLEQAIESIFGKNLQYTKTPTNEWQMFGSYSSTKLGKGSTILLKLIEVPSSLSISEEVAQNTKIKFKNLIHEVEFYQLQRNIDYSLYLLKTQNNLISVSSYIQIKRKSGQKIPEKLILNFIQFAKKLESHPLSHKISFSPDQIGIDSSNNFVLANYETYFVPLDPKKQKNNKNLSNDIKRVLLKFFNPSETQTNLAEIYSFVEQSYSQNMLSLVEKCINGNELQVSQILTTYSSQSEIESFLQTTLTESFNSGIVTVSSDNLNSITPETIDLEQVLIAKEQKASPKKSKVSIFALLFILILVISGVITFKYLKPRPLLCLDSQYLDQQNNVCLSCDPTCDRCQSSGESSCISCRQKFYLVKIERIDRGGRCSLSCEGKKLNSYTCIVNY